MGIGKAVVREENRSNDFRCVLQQEWIRRLRPQHLNISQIVCFQCIDALHGTDAIRLTLLLQKTTLDP